jgi:hypothetical protein
MAKTKEQSSVSVRDEYSSGHYDPRVGDEQRKVVLYTADGKPLGKNPQRIGFGK